MLVLYQAEWCHFSAAVRELLTEAGIDFVARQVEPWPEQRAGLAAKSAHATIPVLEAEDGSLHRGTREIFDYVATLEPGPSAAEHRRRFEEHRAARESDAVGKLVARAEVRLPAAPEPDEPVVTNDEAASEYVLRIGGTQIGLAAYRLRGDEIAFTHTEIDPTCEGRGYGSALVGAALADARERGLTVLPLCPFVAAYLERHPEA